MANPGAQELSQVRNNLFLAKLTLFLIRCWDSVLLKNPSEVVH